MITTKNVREHFGNKIINYESQIRKNPLWSIIKSLEKRTVLKLLCANKNDTILDVGSGPGIYAQLLKETGCQLFCVDSSEAMIKAVKQKGIPGIVSCAENLSLNEHFDKIICLGVLEFVNDPAVVIRQLKNHLKENGCLILLMPKKSIPGIIYKTFHRLHKLKINLFTIKEIITLLSECNLQITAVKVLLDFSCVIKTKPILIEKS